MSRQVTDAVVKIVLSLLVALVSAIVVVVLIEGAAGILLSTFCIPQKPIPWRLAFFIIGFPVFAGVFVFAARQPWQAEEE